MKLRRLPEAPFAIDSLPCRLDGDASLLSIVCKATYSLHEGQCAFAPIPVDIFEDEQYHGPSGALYAPRDLLPAKAHPEVIAVWPASENARMSLEGATIPLRPPVAKDNGQALKSTAELAMQPLVDFDPERYQFTTREQWVEKLPIGVPFTLHDAHPRKPKLTTRLPPHQPIVRVESMATTSFVVPLRADLLWLDVERDLLTVTWRGQVHGFDDSLVLALGMDDGQHAEWPSNFVAHTILPRNGQSRSIESGRPDERMPRAKRTRSRETQAISAVGPGSKTSPGLPQPDWLPTWLDKKPLPRPSSPPPRSSAGRAERYSSPPPPPPAPGRSSVPPRPSPPPSPFPSRSPSPWPSAPPPHGGAGPAMAAMPAPARVPDGRWVDSGPPPPPTAAVIPPNPALAMIDARRDVSPSPIVDEETSGVHPSCGVGTLALDLLWASDDCTSHMIGHRMLERFLPEEPPPPPPSAPVPILGRVPREPSPPTAVEPDERVIRRALRGAEATGLYELHDRLLEFAYDETQPDLVVVMLKGELVISYDQRTALRIMMDTARPLADPKTGDLASAVEHAERVIDTPLAEDPGILKSVTGRLLEAWTSKKRDLPKDFLAEHTRRLLLKHRHHDERKVLGDECVRTFFRRGAEEVPVYLSPVIAACLPSVFSFEARVMAKIVPRQDELEPCRVALVPLALARVIDDAESRPSSPS